MRSSEKFYHDSAKQHILAIPHIAVTSGEFPSGIIQHSGNHLGGVYRPRLHLCCHKTVATVAFACIIIQDGRLSVFGFFDSGKNSNVKNARNVTLKVEIDTLTRLVDIHGWLFPSSCTYCL